jgi:MoxR-like ATPase
MNSVVTVTHKQLSDFLLNVAIVRPVFIWGPPGIGKSSLVRDFAGKSVCRASRSSSSPTASATAFASAASTRS